MKKYIVECRKLYKDYLPGKITVKALKNVNLKIEEGEFTAIVGPSGSGKTTLLNLIGCLDIPTKGDVFLNNILVSSYKDKNRLADIRRDNIGFIFQTFNLIPVLTVYENVNFVLNLKGTPEDEGRRLTLRLLKEVGLKGLEDRFPNELSGGQQQRVAVARAIVKSPAIVLADEPTANLDSITGEKIMKLLSDLNKKKGITFIFSTHDEMVMKFAHRIIKLHDGKIVSDIRRKK